jgi:hypothetical protein
MAGTAQSETSAVCFTQHKQQQAISSITRCFSTRSDHVEHPDVHPLLLMLFVLIFFRGVSFIIIHIFA